MARSIDQLVNQQVLRWATEAKANAERESGQTEKQRPMITISREFGGRGAEIGKHVAERLGFRFYAQEIVHEIARQAHVRQQLVESLDERLQDRIGQWVTEMMQGGVFAPSDYLYNLSQVVVTLGRHGRGVIIGRGAHLILAPETTLRVRAFAPLETRIEYTMARENLDRVEARAFTLRIDAERIAFYRQHFNVDVGDPLLYDMMLNTGSMSVDLCADLIVQAYRAKFG